MSPVSALRQPKAGGTRQAQGRNVDLESRGDQPSHLAQDWGTLLGMQDLDSVKLGMAGAN